MNSFLWLWYLIVIVAMIYCSVVDLRERRIPNVVTYPLLAGSLLVTAVVGQWPSALIGGLLAGGVLIAPRLISGKKAVGMGDVKLAMIGGMLVGSQSVIPALLLAFVTALLVMLPLLLLKKVSWKQAVPFGPFLSLGFGVVLIGMLL